jgi:hypothetical protein
VANATTYLANALANHVLRGTAYTAPSNRRLALFTTATTDAGGGTEVTGGSYARQSVTFSAPSNGAVENTADVVFTNMPAATVTHWAIMDATTGGNMLLHGALNAPAVVSSGQDLPFVAGDIDITAV